MKNLEDIPKTNNFKVPDKYFENLESRINESLKNEKPVSKVSAFDVFKPYMYMAASILVLVFLLKTVLHLTVDKNDKLPNTTITEDIDDYDDFLSELVYDEFAFYEYINEQYSEDFISSEIVNTDEDLAYLEDYLSQYYLEYELLYE